LVDIDQDGHLDLVSGSYSRMEQDMAGLFQVLYGQSGGTFKSAQILKGADGQPLLLPGKREDNSYIKKICTRQFIVDWDGDGKLDLVTGNFEGGFYWFKGEGKGKFSPTAQLITTADGKPLKLPEGGHHSDPFVIDFDGDGALDLLSGSTDAGVYLAHNTAGPGKPPVLEPFKAVVFPAGKEWERNGKPLREKDVERPTYGCRIWVADVNGDGKLDILVGDQVTLSHPKPGISDEEMTKRYAAWQKELTAAQTRMSNPKPPPASAKPKPDRKANANPLVDLIDVAQDLFAADDASIELTASQDFSKVYESRSKFMTEEVTGYVWVYLQK